MEPVIKDDNDEQTDTDQQTDTDRTDGDDSVATPSQSRSPSVHPADEDAPDVFDGYSFKGRHSIILDEEEDEDDGDESGEDEEEDDTTSSIVGELDSLMEEPTQEVDEPVTNGMATVAEVPEPSTPEAMHSAPLPEAPAVSAQVVETPAEAPPKAPPKASKDMHEPKEHKEPKELKTPVEKPAVAASATPPPQPETIVVKAPVPRPAKLRTRREKSGIPALDRDIADDDELPTERDDDEDDDWDFVDRNVDEERNGTKATSLFARGVVDRYKLAVFRKSTPRRTSGRNISAISNDSDLVGSPDASESPTPAEKYRRGRNPGLTFRRNPKEFLRQRSPTRTASASTSSKTMSHSTLATLSTTSSTAARLTASPSLGSTLPVTPSLKSKQSEISVGAPSDSSEQSFNGELKNSVVDSAKSTPTSVSQDDKQKSKGLRKYKEGAEKVLSIFQSPR